MKHAIYVSIKPPYVKKIIARAKNYEFRSYIPKQEIDKLYVYESYPTTSLKYVITLGKIVRYPEKIPDEGDGNKEFNLGTKGMEYAYEIKHVDILDAEIPLPLLKEVFSFFPPQAYAYDTKYPELTKVIEAYPKQRIY